MGSSADLPARRCSPTCGKPAAVLHLVRVDIQQKLSCRAASPAHNCHRQFPPPSAAHRGVQARSPAGAVRGIVVGDFLRRLVASMQISVTITGRFPCLLSVTNVARLFLFHRLRAAGTVARIWATQTGFRPQSRTSDVFFSGPLRLRVCVARTTRGPVVHQPPVLRQGFRYIVDCEGVASWDFTRLPAFPFLFSCVMTVLLHDATTDIKSRQGSV